jgi:hypothetical protein
MKKNLKLFLLVAMTLVISLLFVIFNANFEFIFFEPAILVIRNLSHYENLLGIFPSIVLWLVSSSALVVFMFRYSKKHGLI